MIIYKVGVIFSRSMCQPLLLCWKQQTKTQSHRKQTISSLNKKKMCLWKMFLLSYNYDRMYLTLCRCHGSTMWCVRGFFFTFPDLFYRVSLRIPCNLPFNFAELSFVIIFYIETFFSTDSFSSFEMADLTLSQCLTSRGQQRAR